MPSLTKVQSGFVEAQGALPLSSGTAAAPGLKFDDHAGTGMFSPSTGEIAFSTSGHSQAVTFKTDGKVGIGTNNPPRMLSLEGTTPIIRIGNNNTSYAEFQYAGGANYQKSRNGTSQGIFIWESTNGTTTEEKFRIDSSGRLLAGGTTNTSNAWDGGDDIVIGNTTSGTRTGITLVSGNDTDGGIYWSAGTGNDAYRGQIAYNHASDAMSFYTDSSSKLVITSGGIVRVPDNGKFTAGDNDDLQISHDGATSIISGMYHPIEIRHQSEVHIKCVDDAQVELYHNNVKKFETTSYGAKFSDNVLFNNPDTTGRNLTWEADNDALHWEDNTKATFGGGNDLQIYHDGNHNRIKSVTGGLYIHVANGEFLSQNGSEVIAKFLQNAAVELYYDNVKKLETDVDGIRIGSGGGNNTIIDLHNASYDNGVIQYYNGSIALKTGSSSGDRTFQVHTAGTEKLRITSAGDAIFKGKVTLGEDYSGGEVFRLGKSSGSSYSAYHTGGTAHGFIGYADQLVTAGGATDFAIRSTNNLVFATNGANERLRITSDGKVGIDQSSPQSKVQIDLGDSVNYQNGDCFTLSSGDGSSANLVNKLNFGVSSTNNYAWIQSIKPGTDSLNLVLQPSGGNVGISDTAPQAGLSVLQYGNRFVNDNSTYYQPSGRIFTLVGSPANGADSWFGISGGYNNTSGSVNLLLQQNFNNTSQQAGCYIANEATGTAASVLTFGHMYASSSVTGRPSKVERLRIDVDGHLQIRREGVASVTNTDSRHTRYVVKQTNGQEAIVGSVFAQGKSSWGGDLVFATKEANANPSTGLTERWRIDQNGYLYSSDSGYSYYFKRYRGSMPSMTSNNWVTVANTTTIGDAGIWILSFGRFEQSNTGSSQWSVTYVSGPVYLHSSNGNDGEQVIVPLYHMGHYQGSSAAECRLTYYSGSAHSSGRVQFKPLGWSYTPGSTYYTFYKIANA